MLLEYIELGPTPCEEDCAQLGTEDFRKRATKEMHAYVNQLYRQFADAYENGVTFKIKWFNHDFGTYGEVCAFWDMDDRKATEYVYSVEGKLPSNWDDEAIKELENGNE